VTLSRLKEDIQRMVEDPEMPRPRNRQTLMFSATFPDEIQKMAYAYMAEYLFLTVGIVGGACLDVVQTVHQVNVILGSSQLASTCTVPYVSWKENG
jgi:probable ATP-dependent RNA helicase DDX4